MDARDDGIAELEKNNGDMLAELADLSDEKLVEPFAGTWSAREILVHIGAWYEMMGQAYERMGRGERPAPDGVNLGDSDAMNALYVQQSTGKPVAAVRNDLGAGLARFEAAARALPADRFEEGKTAGRILKTMAEHPLEHVADIRAWKQQH